MDNASGQKEKAEEIKREVKNAAARRRGTLLMDDLEPTTAGLGGDVELVAEPNSGSLCAHTQPDIEPASSNALQNFWNRPDWSPTTKSSDMEPKDSELDRRFMMFYFDNFFPFLFPFYKPSLLEGGRSWIMELIVGHQAMWYTTLCLSTYFVSIALDGSISGPNICKTLAWEKLLSQMETTFTTLQQDLKNLASEDRPNMIVNTSRIMGSLVQLQRFEISVGNFENCQKHLDAAITLFEEVFRAADSVTNNIELHSFYNALSQMGREIWHVRSQERRAWSSDQAAFRFYSALLILDDVIASTSMEEPPKLLEYHVQLLTNNHCPDGRPPLSLEEFIGCENWVMLQIGQISALDAWKKSMIKAGQLDMMELVARASMIKQILLGNLARLDAVANAPRINPLGLFTNNDQLPPMPGGTPAFVTRVWAHAALLYLSTTVSGWQPASANVRESVLRVLTLLEQMPAPELLRTMIWPFCVVGCLAAEAEECRLRAMADALVPHRLFGPARKALEIMENVWRRRPELGIDTDFAACASGLGCTTLLV